MKSALHPSTEYMAVARTRLYAIVVLLFLLGFVAGLMAGYMLWSPASEPPPGPQQKPGHEKVRAR